MKGNKRTCHYCKRETNNPSRDHKFPRSKIRELRRKGEPLPDGIDLNKNTVWACWACNANKGAKSYEWFKGLGVEKIRQMKREFYEKVYKRKKRKATA